MRLPLLPSNQTVNASLPLPPHPGQLAARHSFQPRSNLFCEIRFWCPASKAYKACLTNSEITRQTFSRVVFRVFAVPISTGAQSPPGVTTVCQRNADCPLDSQPTATSLMQATLAFSFHFRASFIQIGSFFNVASVKVSNRREVSSCICADFILVCVWYARPGKSQWSVGLKRVSSGDGVRSGWRLKFVISANEWKY